MRQLEQKMIDYLDKKLKNNAFAQQAIQNKLPRLVMVEAAKACVGITEDTGRNDGVFIKLIQETVGGSYYEPYCAGGVMTCVAYAELRCGVKSHLKATEGAQDIYYSSAKLYRVKSIPLPGAIQCWGDVGKSTGHVEIVLAADDKVIHNVGFNTSGSTDPNSQVNREGNGVFYTVRSYKSTSKRKLLGFIKPF